MKSSYFDESDVIPWETPQPRTTAERATLMRIHHEQRYMGIEFCNRSFDRAYEKGELARRWGRPKEDCPIGLETDGSVGVLRMGWELGWEMEDEEIFIGSL